MTPNYQKAIEDLVKRYGNRFALLGNKEANQSSLKQGFEPEDYADLQDFNSFAEDERIQTELQADLDSLIKKAVREARIEELNFSLRELRLLGNSIKQFPKKLPVDLGTAYLETRREKIATRLKQVSELKE